MTHNTNQTEALTSPGMLPLSDSLILGYPAKNHMFLSPKKQKPSFLDRFRKHRPAEPETDPAPYEVNRGGERRPLVTVHGPPGSGKTTLLCSLLDQFRDHTAYIVHDWDLLHGMRDRLGLGRGDYVWWDGLTDITLDPWGKSGDLPSPPALEDIPRGSLVMFDLGSFRQVLAEGCLAGERVLRERASEWLSFESEVARAPRSLGFTVVSAVLTEDTREAWKVPLGSFQSPLGGETIQVRPDPLGGARVGYEVKYPMGGPAGRFTLTKGGEA